ncbi:hypothetical protein [uncultured Ruegeria sp.]|nr:hypothetical protein [uncultured Ruegeria sp.]
MKEVVISACCCAEMADDAFIALCDSAAQIRDDDYREEVFRHLLFAAAGHPMDNGALRLCQAVAAFSGDSNSTYINSVEAVLAAWRGESSAFDDEVRELSKLLKGLFADQRTETNAR